MMIVPENHEMDFGNFGNKPRELFLQGSPDYDKVNWHDSSGTICYQFFQIAYIHVVGVFFDVT